MNDPAPPLLPGDLAPATPEEIAAALSYALRFDERANRARAAGILWPAWQAERLTEYLRRSGFVILCAPSSRPHSIG